MLSLKNNGNFEMSFLQFCQILMDKVIKIRNEYPLNVKFQR